jgi:hypothetical protein
MRVRVRVSMLVRMLVRVSNARIYRERTSG